MRAAIVAALLAAIAAGVLVFRPDGGDGSGAPTLEGAPTPDDATPEADLGPLDDQRPVVGQPAPDFALRDLDGNVIRLSELRGNVVWINFWATWCRPCKKELPGIQRLQDERRDDGLIVLAVNWEESADEARQFLEDAGLSLRTLLDRSGAVYDQYRLQGLPDSFFVARDGTLAAVHYGFLSESKMRERLMQAGLE